MSNQKVLSKTQAEKAREVCTTLDGHVAALAEEMEQGKSEALLRYLEVTSRFHNYSFGNILLAIWQCPHMTRIAGIRLWNRLGRKVKKGEKGIMILAPMIKKVKPDTDPNESETLQQDKGKHEEKMLLGFRVAHVFDISQTEGKPLPSLINATGDAGQPCAALEQALKKTHIELVEQPTISIAPGAEGISLGSRIIIRSDLSEANRFRVIAHEYAHEILHHKGEKADKKIRETEADATAYVICRHFAVHCDTSDYLLLYNSNPRILLSRLEVIRETANRVITEIEEAMQSVPEKEPCFAHEPAVAC